MLSAIDASMSSFFLNNGPVPKQMQDSLLGNPKPCNSSSQLVMTHSAVTSVTSFLLQQKNDEECAQQVPASHLPQQPQQQDSVHHSTIFQSKSTNALLHNSVNPRITSSSSSPMRCSFQSLFQPHQSNASISVSELPNSPQFSSSPLYKSSQIPSSPTSELCPPALSLSRPLARLASPAASADANFSVSLSSFSASSSSASVSRSRSIFSPLHSSFHMSSNSNWNSSFSNPSPMANHIQLQDVAAATVVPSSSPLPSPVNFSLTQENSDSVAFCSINQLQTCALSFPEISSHTVPVLAMSPLTHHSISTASTSSSAFYHSSSFSEAHAAGLALTARASSASSFHNLQSAPLSSPVLPSAIRRGISSPTLDLQEFNNLSEDDKESPLQTPLLERQISFDSAQSASSYSSDSSNSYSPSSHSSPMQRCRSPAVFLRGSPPIDGDPDDLQLPSPDELLAQVIHLPLPACTVSTLDEKHAEEFGMQLYSERNTGKRGRKRSASTDSLALDSSEEDDDEVLSTISSLSTVQSHSNHSVHASINEDEMKQLSTTPPTMSASTSFSSLSSLSSASSSSSSSHRASASSDKEEKNLKRSKKRRTCKKEQRLSSILAHYPFHSAASTHLLYPAKDFYFHPPSAFACTAPSDFSTSQWIHSPQFVPQLPAASQSVVMKWNEVEESKRCELVIEVDLGTEAAPGNRLLMTTPVSLFHESKSLCTTSSSMRKRAQQDDAAFFEISSPSIYFRALPAELTMEDSPMLHAFTRTVSTETCGVLHMWTPGYPLRYRDRVNAKKAEAYASILALSGAEVRISLIPPARYPNAVIRSAALHVADNKGAAKHNCALMPAQPVHATPNRL